MAGTDTAVAHDTVELLRKALTLHDRTHTPDCPVCGTKVMRILGKTA